jgi:integrin beta 8
MSCYCQVEVTKVENVLEITSPGPQGIPGGDAPDVQIEYSADNLTWAETYTEGDYYARFSTDGGDTWGTGVMFRGPQGEQGVQGDIGPEGPEVLFQYSADGVDWHSTYMAGDDYFSVSTDEGETWGEAVYFRGEQGIQGEIGPAGPTGPEVMVQYSADGETWNAVYTDGDDYIRFSMDEGNTWGSAVYIRGPQGIPGEDGPQGDPGTPAPELKIEYSADNSSWSDSYTAGDYYARFSTDGGSTWGSALLIRGEQGLQGDEGPIGDTGPQGPAGTPAPALEIEYSADGNTWSTTYTAGDYYARFSVDGGSNWGAGLLFRGPQGETGLTGPEGAQGPQGQQGETGPAGEDGADGRTILSGTVDPTTEGVDGDFYINTATSTLFGPKNGTWPTGVSLVGPAGADGEDGTDGTNGQGVPTGGTTGQVLAKSSATDYDTEWVDASSGGGGVSLGLVIALS